MYLSKGTFNPANCKQKQKALFRTQDFSTQVRWQTVSVPDSHPFCNNDYRWTAQGKVCSISPYSGLAMNRWILHRGREREVCEFTWTACCCESVCTLTHRRTTNVLLRLHIITHYVFAIYYD